MAPLPIPARTGLALALPKNSTLRITNTHGTQVVDFWAFTVSPSSSNELTTFLSLPHTRTSTLHLTPHISSLLFSNLRTPLLQLTADTSPGVHDTLIAACDPQRYRQLGVPDKEGHNSCAQNLRSALSDIGIPWPVGTLLEDWTPAPLNLWMNIPVSGGGEEGGRRGGGALRFEAPVSKAGDYVEVRALVEDVVCVMSCCPQDLLKVNGVGMRPVGVEVEVLGRVDVIPGKVERGGR